MSSNPKEWIPIPGLVSMTLQEKDYTCMPVLVNLLHSSIGDHLVWVNSLIIVSAFRIVLHMCHQLSSWEGPSDAWADDDCSDIERFRFICEKP